MNIDQFCNFDKPLYLLISENVPPLVYYSHLPIVLISIVIGLYVYFNAKKELPNKILLVMTLAYSIWVFLDSVFWASNRGDVIMFVWSIQVLVEPLVHLSSLYLLYVFLYRKDLNFKYKFLLILLYTPLIILTPTKFILSSFDISTCLSQESIYSYYSYLIEIFYTSLIIYLGVKKYLFEKDAQIRRQIIYLTSGIIILLFAFSWGAITGSFTEDWNLAQYGLFGMPIFTAFLAYIIIKFKSFNLKLIGSNVLVLSLWILTASLLTIQDIDTSHAVTGITLIISIIFGFILIQSVRNEVSQREKNERLAFDLTSANNRLLEIDKQKSEFVSFATHQLRAPLTAMKGYTSLILEGEMGKVNADVKQAVKRIFDSSSTLENIVDDYLNISRIELGTLQYNFDMVNLKDVLDSVVGELKPNIEKKGLEFNVMVNSTGINTRFMVRADKDKIKQVISNLIDNSVKYTPLGSINVSLDKDTNRRKILISIKDTGVGISPDVMPKLFSKFVRADNANKQNIFGTGLGLYIASQIALAHHGRIWAESRGEGKGSEFYFELDMEL